MTSTDSLPESVAVENRAVGYVKAQNGELQPNTGNLPPRGTSAGGGYSTVGDLLRFANALAGHKLLNPQYTELATTGKVDTRPETKYCYGFHETIHEGIRSFGHGGGAPGVNGDLIVYPGSGYVVAALANLDAPAATRIAEFIGDRLPATTPLPTNQRRE